MRRAFTLIELLVVVGIISLLMGILMPTLSRAREQARTVVVNSELYGIALALESYFMDNDNRYPPTRADCNPWARKHAYALPEELVNEKYLPKGEAGRIRFAKVEDEFNKGCTYKYIAVGPKFDYLGAPFGNQHLYIPECFPDSEQEELVKYTDPRKSPVTWVLFSIGPDYDKESLEESDFPLKEGFPVSRRFWYSSRTGRGIITRLRLRTGRQMGSFEE